MRWASLAFVVLGGLLPVTANLVVSGGAPVSLFGAGFCSICTAFIAYVRGRTDEMNG